MNDLLRIAVRSEQSAPVGSGPTVCDPPSVSVTASGSNPATGSPRNVQATSIVYAVPAGTRGALEVKPGDEHPALAWSHGRGGAYMPTPILYRGLLYVVHHNGRLVAYDAASGEAIYKRPLEGAAAAPPTEILRLSTRESAARCDAGSPASA